MWELSFKKQTITQPWSAHFVFSELKILYISITARITIKNNPVYKYNCKNYYLKTRQDSLPELNSCLSIK